MIDERLADFKRRTDFAVDSVYRHEGQGWAYIPIHPFADEPDELTRLHITADECSAVDAWCSMNGDATLVQMSTRGGGSPQGVGLYARKTEHRLAWVYLIAIVDSDNITRDMFEHTMSRFVALGFPTGDCFSLDCSDGLVRIGDVDAFEKRGVKNLFDPFRKGLVGPMA